MMARKPPSQKRATASALRTDKKVPPARTGLGGTSVQISTPEPIQNKKKARRRAPEADAQRAIVTFLRMVLPQRAIVHHSANEVRGSGHEHKRAQGLAVGMGVHAGFADLLVMSERRLLFLEVKSKTGRPTDTQREFENDCVAQGHAYEIVRSVEDTRAALAKHNFTTRERRML